MGVDAPEKVVREFGRGRLLEAGDARALRIESGEDVFDRTILAAGVERLQDDEDRMFVLSIEQRLLAEKFLAIGFDLLLGFVLRGMLAFVGRVDLPELQLGVRIDAKFFSVVHARSSRRP